MDAYNRFLPKDDTACDDVPFFRDTIVLAAAAMQVAAGRIFLLIIRDSADASELSLKADCVHRDVQRRSHDRQALSLDRDIRDVVCHIYTDDVSHRAGVILP